MWKISAQTVAQVSQKIHEEMRWDNTISAVDICIRTGLDFSEDY